MRDTWIGTGWKMNHLQSDAEAYAATLRAGLGSLPGGLHVFVVPPFTALRRVRELTAGLPLHVSAQNMHWEERGAFTGEISAAMLVECGVDLVELGHSERRAMFGETDAAVNRKVLAALAHGLRPLVCVGETGEEKALGAARETVARQVKMALHGVPRDRAREVLVAYEPVWAIGTAGVPAEPGYASQIHGALREALRDLFGAEVASEACLLYGGSVNLENAPALLASADVDGLFVGRTAWKAEGLLALVRLAEAARAGRS